VARLNLQPANSWEYQKSVMYSRHKKFSALDVNINHQVNDPTVSTAKLMTMSDLQGFQGWELLDPIYESPTSTFWVGENW